MHYKRRKRKRYGVKGHCWMCAMQTRSGGLRNKRLLTKKEKQSLLDFEEQIYESINKRIRTRDRNFKDKYL